MARVTGGVQLLGRTLLAGSPRLIIVRPQIVFDGTLTPLNTLNAVLNVSVQHTASACLFDSVGHSFFAPLFLTVFFGRRVLHRSLNNRSLLARMCSEKFCKLVKIDPAVTVQVYSANNGENFIFYKVDPMAAEEILNVRHVDSALVVFID